MSGIIDELSGFLTYLFFAVFTCTVKQDRCAENDLDKHGIVLSSIRSQVFARNEIKDTDAGGEKSADYKKPKKKIISLHVGLYYLEF